MARSKKTRKPRRRQRTKAIEWVGTQVSLPAMIDDDDTEPYHPGLVLWLSLPEGLIVGQEMFHPDDIDVALRHSLAVALEEAPRSARPARVRLSDPRLVEAAREVLGPEAQIVVAPVPEVEELVEGLVASMDREEPSYFEDDSIPVDCVRDLFAAAAYLYRARPWEGAGDQQVVRFDSPELGVDGVCVSILGQAGETLGIALFPSLDAFDGFCDAAAEDDDGISAAPVEMGSESIVLLFEEGEHLPARLLAEVEEHGLEVAGQGAYPLPLHCGPGGERLPLNEHEVRVLAACAHGIGSFYLRHGSLFRDELFEPVSETYEEAGGLEVRMTAPYESFDEFEDEFEDDDEFEDGFGNELNFEVEPPPKLPTPPRAGRNEPCPCGSGKKYKKCHLPLDEAERHAEAQASVLHDLDRSLVTRIDAFARQRFGRLDWTSDAFDDPRLSAALATPYHVWGHRIEGRTPAQWFREAHDEHLSRRERGWFDAQQDAWLSLWEVRDVEPGRGLTLFDFLTGTSRPVIEAQGSQTLAPNDVVLARVVRYEGEDVLCGLYPRALPPRDGAAVVEKARKRLRRKGDVPVERLRDDKISVYLIRRFEEAVDEMLQRYAGPRQLANTDGDELLMTSDHFDITPGREADLERGLAALEGASAEQGDEGFSVDFLREADPSSPAPLRQTLIGQALVAGGRLSVETNSIRRADALRSRIEAACGDLLQHRARSHADPLSTSAKAPSSPPPTPPPGAEEAVRALLEEHYATWPDVALPALGGQTPREASRTKEGKRELDLLLKEMENQEARMPAGPGFDFSKLRRELGVE